MPNILHIETATTVCSTLLTHNGDAVLEKISYEGPSHATLLPQFIEESLQFAKQNDFHLDAMAVSSGPGSYTGLRIGVATAKGICYGLNIPLIAIPTLQIIALHAQSKMNAATSLIYAPMIDARRMEVYTALYDATNAQIEVPQAMIIDTESFQTRLATEKIVFCGNGAEKCKVIIVGDNALFVDDCNPLARLMVAEAERRFAAKQFEDLAYYEPFYLKEFQVSTPKKSILNKI